MEHAGTCVSFLFQFNNKACVNTKGPPYVHRRLNKATPWRCSGLVQALFSLFCTLVHLTEFMLALNIWSLWSLLPRGSAETPGCERDWAGLEQVCQTDRSSSFLTNISISLRFPGSTARGATHPLPFGPLYFEIWVTNVGLSWSHHLMSHNKNKLTHSKSAPANMSCSELIYLLLSEVPFGSTMTFQCVKKHVKIWSFCKFFQAKFRVFSVKAWINLFAPVLNNVDRGLSWNRRSLTSSAECESSVCQTPSTLFFTICCIFQLVSMWKELKKHLWQMRIPPPLCCLTGHLWDHHVRAFVPAQPGHSGAPLQE